MTPQSPEAPPARTAAEGATAATLEPTASLAPPPATAHTPSALPTYRVPWAALLRKVFDVDVLACPECGGRLRLLAFIAEPTVARKILDHLGLDSTGPPTAPRRSERAEQVDPAPDYDVADPVYHDT